MNDINKQIKIDISKLLVFEQSNSILRNSDYFDYKSITNGFESIFNNINPSICFKRSEIKCNNLTCNSNLVQLFTCFNCEVKYCISCVSSDTSEYKNTKYFCVGCSNNN